MKAFAALILHLAISVHAVPFGIFERMFSTSELNAVESRQNTPSGSAVNQRTINLIESLEGFTTNFVNVNCHPTIGFGHHCTEQTNCGSIHAPLSKDPGTQLLQKDLPQFTSCVAKLPNCNKLNANQFGALTSFAFNSGCGNLAKFFNGAMQQGNPSAACNALPNTNTLGGELSSRRQKEAAFGNSPTNEPAICNGTASTGSGGTGTNLAAAGQASNKAGAGGGRAANKAAAKVEKAEAVEVKVATPRLLLLPRPSPPALGAQPPQALQPRSPIPLLLPILAPRHPMLVPNLPPRRLPTLLRSRMIRRPPQMTRPLLRMSLLQPLMLGIATRLLLPLAPSESDVSSPMSHTGYEMGSTLHWLGIAFNLSAFGSKRAGNGGRMGTKFHSKCSSFG
jgi:lysozyme